MKGQGNSTSDCKVGAVWNYLQAASPDLVAKMADAFHLHHAILEPTDSLYMPAGMVVSEAVGGEYDTTGVRIPCINKVSSAKEELNLVKNSLAAQSEMDEAAACINAVCGLIGQPE